VSLECLCGQQVVHGSGLAGFRVLRLHAVTAPLVPVLLFRPTYDVKWLKSMILKPTQAVTSGAGADRARPRWWADRQQSATGGWLEDNRNSPRDGGRRSRTPARQAPPACRPPMAGAPFRNGLAQKKRSSRGTPQVRPGGCPRRSCQPIIAGLAAFTDRVLKLFSMVPVLPSPL